MADTDVSIQLYVSAEEYAKLWLKKTTKQTWKQFLVDPILNPSKINRDNE